MRFIPIADEFAAEVEDIDLSKNPDLAPAARTAAGSLELIDLLRRARMAIT